MKFFVAGCWWPAVLIFPGPIVVIDRIIEMKENDLLVLDSVLLSGERRFRKKFQNVAFLKKNYILCNGAA